MRLLIADLVLRHMIKGGGKNKRIDLRTGGGTGRWMDEIPPSLQGLSSEGIDQLLSDDGRVSLYLRGAERGGVATGAIFFFFRSFLCLSFFEAK